MSRSSKVSGADLLGALRGGTRLVDANGHPVFAACRGEAWWFCRTSHCLADSVSISVYEDVLPFEVYDDDE